MTNLFSITATILILLIFVSCNSQELDKQNEPAQILETVEVKKQEAHRYGGWYCPDNFGFVPVDIQKLDEVPAIANRLPTKQELDNNMSLINVDKLKYPTARAMEMDLPRVASIYSERKGMSELIIVIQAIIVQEDTVVGYRFANGGNGSAWLSDVTFLSDAEVDNKGSQPFFYSKSMLKANPEDIWDALRKTDYFKQLGEKFDKKEFFSSKWNAGAEAHLKLDTDKEKASGYVGMVYGNYYLQVDYNRKGFHYSEKILIMENQEKKTTELFFASGPYPKDFKKQKAHWGSMVELIKKDSEAN